jgi:hypothetical protein
MKMKHKSQIDVIGRASLAIENSLSTAEIQAAVADYGYPAEKLLEARALVDATQAAVDGRVNAKADRVDAAQDFNQALAAAHEAYRKLAKTARVMCDKATLSALGLVGPEPRTTGGFLKAASTLFENAADAPVLAQYGYDAAQLAAGRAAVVALQAAGQRSDAARGAALAATAQQREALKSLRVWLARYIAIAKLALRENPQRLEALGVLVRSGKTAAQRAAIRARRKSK